jgi:putative peptidoglycan lipid II flippase
VDKLLKNTVLIGFLTFFSRVLGLIRDALIAMVFGAGVITDAFFIAFRPFDLVRKMFSEGVFGTCFIPAFSAEYEQKGRKAALRLAGSLLCLLSAAGIAVVVIGMLAGPAILAVMAPGFAPGSFEHQLTLMLFRIMLPYIWFIMITALCMGVLNYFDDFMTPALAPVVFNLTVIAATVWVAVNRDTSAVVLAAGVAAGGLLQMALQIPALKKLGIFESVAFKRAGTRTWRVLRLMLPAMVGAACYQINIVTASFFASALDEGSVSVLYFADRLVQFPLGLFVVSAATVFLPALSKDAAAKNYSGMGETFSDGICLVLFITLPAMAGLLALDVPIVTILFQRGLFDAVAVQKTAECLFFLVSGLWAFASVRLLATLHFALGNVRTPFYSGLLSIIVNVTACRVLIGPLGLNGLAFAVVLASVAGFAFLCATLPGRVLLKKKVILVSACRSVFVSGIMFFLVKTLYLKIEGAWQGHPAGVVLPTLICILIGASFYLGSSFCISSPELNRFLDGIKKKRI